MEVDDREVVMAIRRSGLISPRQESRLTRANVRVLSSHVHCPKDCGRSESPTAMINQTMPI